MKQREWKDEFINLGGFKHLLKCLSELSLETINSRLELKAIESIMKVIFKFV